MAETLIEIKGKVIDNKTYAGIPDCSVELWVKSTVVDAEPELTEIDPVSTQDDGSFTISGTVEVVDYNYFVKIFHNGVLIKSTEDQPYTQVLPVVCEVSIDAVSAAISETRKISGKVMDYDGTALADKLVKAFDKNFNGEELLGSATTDANGNYLIAYNKTTVLTAFKNSYDTANVVVKLYNIMNNPVVTSPVFFNNSKDLVINLIDSETPYKEQAKTKTQAALIKEKIEDELENAYTDNILNAAIIEDVTKDDLSYLSKKSGISEAEVSTYLQATNFGHSFVTSITEDKVEMLYALVKDGYNSPEKILFASDAKLKAAIQKSTDDNTIDSYDEEEEVDPLLADLRAGIKDALIADTESDLYSVFDAIGLSLSDDGKNEIIDTIIDFYNLTDQSVTSVYDELIQKTTVQNPVITEAQVNKLKLILDLGHILGYLDISCNLIKNGYTIDNDPYTITSVLNFIDVLFNPAISDDVYDAITTTFETKPTKIELLANLEEVMPHMCFNKKLQYGDNAALFNTSTNKIKLFLEDNPEFDLGKDILEQFGEDDELVELGSLTEPQIVTLKEELPKLQRLFNIVQNENKYEVVKSLYEAEIYSASSIATMGEDNFITDFGEAFGDIEEPETINKAKVVYHKALLQATKAMMVWTKYGKDFNTVSNGVFSANKYDAENTPDLAQLFGLVDYCNCSKCRSVLSPAAYLVDLLAFLKEIKTGETTLFDKLLLRRPDLEHILLDCNNSNTPLPTIDLVNEILLCAVSENAPVGYQTTYKAATLAAIPEHDSEADMLDAYTTIKNANYPWSLPFDYNMEKFRISAKQLGVSKYQLMQHFYKPASPYSAHAAIDLATEYLGFIPSEITELTKTHQEDETHFEISDLYGKAIWETGIDITDFNNVKVFLDYAGIPYNELNSLLESYYVNPGETNYTNRILIRFIEEGSFHLKDAYFMTFSSPDYVNISGTTLKTFLERLYKFYKIKSRLSLSVKELDLIIKAYNDFKDTDWVIDNDLFLFLSNLHQLKEKLKLSFEKLLIFYVDFNTTFSYLNETTLYDSLFQNPDYTHPVEEELSSTNQTPLTFNASLTKTNIKPVVRGILQLSETDLETIISNELLTNANVTPQNLSRVYRISLFAHSLGISVDDFYNFKNLAEFGESGRVPWPISYYDQNLVIVDPANTLIAIDAFASIKASVFSIVDLLWLLHNTNASDTDLSISDTDLNTEMIKIGDGLYEILEGCRINLDGLKSFVSEHFAAFLTQNIETADLANFAEIFENIIAAFNNGSLFTGLTSDEKDYIVAYFEYEDLSAFTNSTEYASLFASGTLITNTYERQEYIIKNRDIPLCDLNSENLKNFLSYCINQEKIQPSLDLISAKVFENWANLTEGEQDKLQAEMETLVEDWLATFLTQHAYTENAIGTAIANAKNYLIKDLSQNDYLEHQHDRYAYIINDLMLATLKKFTIKEVSSFLLIDESLTKKMLEEYFVFSNSTKNSMEMVFVSDFIESLKTQLTTANTFDYEEQQKVLLRLFKAAVLIKSYKIDQAALDVLYNYSSVMSCLDIFQLPDNPSADKSSLLKWKTFDTYFLLFNNYFFLKQPSSQKVETGIAKIKPDLFSYINYLCQSEGSAQSKIDAAIAMLANNTGWSVSDITFLALTMLGNSYNENNNTLRNLLVSSSWLAELVNQIRIVSVFRTSASLIVDNNTTEPLAANCIFIHQVLKEKFGIDQWIKIYTPASNILREKLRDALVAYLTGHNNTIGSVQDIKFKDALDIYDYFLIDPLVGTEPLTSRIKQAGLTVQLFIQRILMNLETDLVMDFRHREEWKWRKNYRVWEANRKVFLFPENWLEPELRMDKSYFFKEMEAELLQDEITKEKVEQAYLSYLEKMQETANFEIVGSYLDRADGENDLHVIARTKSHPHVYYYRKYEEMLFWKPWEKMEIEIDGNHIVPVVWNRKLFVFWLKFAGGGSGEKFDFSQINNTNYVPPVNSNLKVNLAWSQFKNGKWVPPSVSREDYCLTNEENEKWSLDRVSDIIFLPFNDNIKDKDHIWGPQNILTNPFQSNPSLDCQAFGIYLDCNGHCHPLLIAEFYRDAVVNFKRADNPYYNEINKLIGTYGRFKYSGDYFLVSAGSNRRDERGTKKVHATLNNKCYFDMQNYFKPDSEAIANSSYYLCKPDSGRLDFFNLQSKSVQVFDANNNSWFWFYKSINCTKTTSVLKEFSKPAYFSFACNDFIFSPKSVDLWKESGLNFKHLFVESDGKIFFGRVSSIPTWVNGNININQPTGGLLMSGGGGLNPNVQLLPEPLDNLPSNNNSSSSQPGSNTPLYFGMGGQTSQINPVNNLTLINKTKYWFQTFYHPFLPFLVKQLHKYGIDGLLDPDHKSAESRVLCRQVITGNLDFISEFKPNESAVALGKYLPVEDIDFSASGPYSIYNWEIFFHAPLTVADRLSQNRQFADAQKWYHYIFDPTDTNPYFPGNARYWKIKPFALMTDLSDMQDLMYDMSKNHGELEAQIQLWRSDPFNPHLIAQFRHLAYMKSVVMKYLDNLLAWGDDLFTQDTMESINEAVQIYVLAAQILGRRPVMIEKPESESKDFADIKNQLDEFSNAIVKIENYISISRKEKTYEERSETVYIDGVPDVIVDDFTVTPMVDTAESILNGTKKTQNGTGFILATVYKSLYFGVPFNDKLLTYWDSFEDRLFKIRHSMNIKGIRRQLALYEPPIDPGLLIKAKAAGLDITQAMEALQTPLPYYRFRVMLQKAQELCNDIKGFGSVLLSALEKKDAEAIALTRSVQERSLLSAVKSIKLKSIEEAQKNIDATNQSIINSEKRRDHYLNREYKIANENLHLEKLRQAKNAQLGAQVIQALGSVLSLLPDFTISVGTDMSAKSTWGSSNLSNALNASANVLNTISAFKQYSATKASIEAGYQRRQEEWDLQIHLAEWEIEQIQKQLLAAQVRLAIAQKDAENHDLQMQHAEDNYEFMKSKYTNEELYNWMITQTSSIYFTMYQYAVKLAKQAERCMLFELGIDATQHADIITYGHWDNLKKGMFAGDKLQFELRQLENFYMENNERLFEINKNISLSMLDADALMNLRTNGSCEFDIPEMLYDMDYPGMYMRRIKSVSITIPANTGPYTNVSCKLSMLSNRYRFKTGLVSNYAYTGIDDERFVQNIVGIQSIATSTAQNDKGLFEFNFNDERYLPFEGAGAIGRWQLELPENFRQFDYESISDAILHISYTAKDAGGTLKEAAIKNLKDNINKMLDMFADEEDAYILLPIDMKATFPDEFHLLTETAEGQTGVNFTITRELFPDFVRDYIEQNEMSLEIQKFEIFAKADSAPTLTIESVEKSLEIANPPLYKDLYYGDFDCSVEITSISDGEEINFILDNTPVCEIENLWVLIRYTIS